MTEQPSATGTFRPQISSHHFLDSFSGASFSHCRTYRFALWRRWQLDEPYVLFIGLNPSTADENEDDPTIRRCKRFAQDWQYGGVVMANIFAFRATDPREMLASENPVGVGNDCWLKYLAHEAGLIVCAWGAHGSYQERDQQVRRLLADYPLTCLGMTKGGQPKHPLYLRADTRPMEYG